ncbi:MAG TPA: DUF2339 domain-containing protein, partial [Longimicrobium sp.]
MHEQDELIARIDRLERVVEELTRRLPAPADPFAAAAPARHDAVPPIPAYAPRPAPAAPVRWDGQLWLNRLGIGLLLLGVAFLFRYSIDQGWLTPAVRLAIGGAVGATLLTAGLRIGDRRRFSAVLVGGGIATFYIVGYAAFSLYSLIGYENAFAGMVGITALAFGLALARAEAALAVIGALGGLGTPLILGISHGSPRAVLVYISLIVAWTAGVYLKRGWRVVLWSSLPGAWLLLLVYGIYLAGGRGAWSANLAMLQAAVVFTWLCTGIFPLAMRVLGARADGRERRWRDVDTLHWYGAAIVPPAAALGITALAWELGGVKWGIAAAICAAGYGAAAALLRTRDVRLARVLLLASSVLLTGAMAAALEGNALVLGLAAQGVALHFLAARGAGEVIRWTAHKAYAAAAIWVMFDLVTHRAADPAAAATVALVLAAGFGASYLQRRQPEVLAYRYFVHAALMGLLWRELARVGGGEGFATVAWGAYTLGMLLFGMWRARPLVEKTALATLLVVVAKLFVVDLAALEAIFRILLFMGFGAVFLFFSYSLQSWLRPNRAGEPPGPDAARGPIPRRG